MSVATTAIVVLAPAALGAQPEKSSASGGLSGSNGCASISPDTASSAAQNRPQSGRTTLPQLFTATSAPTVAPLARRHDALPVPPFNRPALAPKAAPALPSANSCDDRAARAGQARDGAARRSSAAARETQDRTGSLPARSARAHRAPRSRVPPRQGRP